jgi:hypothetical protein
MEDNGAIAGANDDGDVIDPSGEDLSMRHDAPVAVKAD